MTMNDLFDLYIRDCIPTLAPRSQRDYMGIMGILRTHFGHMTPQEVKPRHVRDFLDVKKGKIHRNRMVMILSGVFYKAIGKWCIDDELRNPCVKVERHETRPRERYITDDEFKRFREGCCPQVQIAMDLAYMTAAFAKSSRSYEGQGQHRRYGFVQHANRDVRSGVRALAEEDR